MVYSRHHSWRSAADDGKRARSAIEVVLMAARPLGEGSGEGSKRRGKTGTVAKWRIYTRDLDLYPSLSLFPWSVVRLGGTDHEIGDKRRYRSKLRLW